MNRRILSTIFFATVLNGSIGCTPPVMLPPVHEPLDSTQWVNCANEGEKRESMSLIDDMTLDSKTILCRAVVVASKGGTEKAVEMLNEAAVIDKLDHRPHYLQGRILAEAGRYTEALTSFERSQKRYGEMEVPTERLGRKVMERDGDDEALIFLRNANERSQCNAHGCQGLLAKLYHRAGEDDNAEKIYKKMIENSPDEPAGYVGLASLRNAQGDYLKESTLITKAIKSAGFAELPEASKAKIYYSHAFSRYNAMKLKGAAKSINRALKIEKHGDWFLLAGWIQMKMKDPAMALVKFNKAIDRDDKLSLAHVGKGDSLVELGRLDDAIAAYEQGAFLDPASAVTKLKQAYAYAKNGDTDKAKALLDEATRMDKENLPPELLEKVTKLLP